MIYMRAKNDPDSINECMRLIEITPSGGDLSRYLNRVAALQDSNELWNDGVGPSVLKKDPRVPRHLEDMNLWPGASQWSDVGCLISMVTKHEVSTRIGLSAAKALFLEGKKVAVLCKFEDIPGRVQYFETVHPTEIGTQLQWVIAGNNETEGGLSCLGLLPIDTTTVFALPGNIDVLRLQMYHIQMLGKPAPLVGWNDRSNAAWKYVYARETILWNPTGLEGDISVYKQALRAPNALVVVNSRDTNVKLKGHANRPSALFDLMKLEARPMWDAFKTHLLSVVPQTASMMLRGMDLNDEQWQAVLDVCSNSEESKLLQFKIAADQIRSVEYDGYRITTDGEQWVYSKIGKKFTYGPETLLTDAPIRLDTVVHHDPTAKTYLIGKVIHKGNEYEFKVEESHLRKSTVTYIRDLLVSKGVSYPTFSTVANKKNFMLEVANLMSRPIVIKDKGRIGWDKDSQRYMLPTAVISVDHVYDRSDRNFANIETTPGVKITHKPIDAMSTSDWWLPSKAVAGWWAAFACVISNMLSDMTGYKHSGICVVNSDAGRELVLQLERQLHLLNVTLDDDEQVQLLHRLQILYGLPTVVSFPYGNAKHVNNWLGSGQPCRLNAITTCDIKTAMLLGSVPSDWTVIITDREENPTLPKFDGLVTNFLWHMVKVLKGTKATFRGPIQILSELKEWVAKLRMPDDWTAKAMSTMEAAKLMVNGNMTPGEKLTCLIYLMDFEADKSITEMSKESPSVSINLKALTKEISRQSLPDVLDAADTLSILMSMPGAKSEIAGSKVVMPRSLWEATVAKLRA